MRSAAVVAWMLLGPFASAATLVSIGINLSGYPDLVPVPGYPVYYAPQLDSNYFFYDGLYWIYAKNGWYSSSWYDGPWEMVAPESVPLFMLRVPVRYYQRPPPNFRDWSPDAPPRWGEHWGRDWERRRAGWDHWDRAAAPAPAPLPAYQRGYSGDRYPRAYQQLLLRKQNYHYQPRETFVRQQYKQPPRQAPLAQRQRQFEREGQNTPLSDSHHSRTPVAAEGAVAAGRAESRGQAADEARRLQAERRTLLQPSVVGTEHQREWPEQGAPPRESQPAHSREHADRPPTNAAAAEPRRDPNYDH